MGGMLQHPFERFPRYFDHPFWKAYPYFLPPFVAAVFTIFTFVITLIFFKEVRAICYVLAYHTDTLRPDCA